MHLTCAINHMMIIVLASYIINFIMPHKRFWPDYLSTIDQASSFYFTIYPFISFDLIFTASGQPEGSKTIKKTTNTQV